MSMFDFKLVESFTFLALWTERLERSYVSNRCYISTHTASTSSPAQAALVKDKPERTWPGWETDYVLRVPIYRTEQSTNAHMISDEQAGALQEPNHLQ